MKALIAMFAMTSALVASSAFAGPHAGLECRTVDAAEATIVKAQVSLYSGDLYDDTVVYNEFEDVRIPQENVAQYKNFRGDLFLKFYLGTGKDGEAINGFIVEAQKKGSKFKGKLYSFENEDGTLEKVSKGRPAECQILP